MKPLTDLFGRTAEQLRARIERHEKLLPIVDSYRGNEGFALKIARFRADIEVDKRQLHLVEQGIDPKVPSNDRKCRAALAQAFPDFEYQDSLSGDRLRKWRETLLSFRRKANEAQR